MKKKIFLFLGFLCLILLAACNNTDSSKPDNNKADGQVVITIWDYLAPDSSSDREQKALIEQYEKDHPNIKFERTYIPFADLKTKLLQGIAGNDLPDIVVIDNPDHQSFAEAGVFADITKEVEEWGQADKYYPGAIDSAKLNDKFYGIPNNSNALAIYYNKDLFEAAGITETPKTWAEFAEAAKKLTNGDVKGFAMSGKKSEEGTFQFLPYLWQAGADLDSFDSPEAKNAMTFIQTMINDGSLSKNMINWDQSDVLVQFQTQKAAMMENGPWQIPVLEEQSKDINWGVFLMPSDKDPASVLGGENWAITANSQNKKEAWDFLMWTQQPEILGPMHELGGRLPSREDIGSDSQYTWQKDENVKVFMEQLKTAKPRAYGTKYPEISSNVQEAIQRAMTGEDINKVMDDTAKKIEPLLPKK
ncbi:sugar ABC transporter substrate-binding protein [Bacillus sp. FJAT-50079]|uniref:ABC transporter substrate-binding protein n=1 Tax=Bacillus sp. FJAT-50079 TaxID=2833577 RepID=UPI001BCA1E97|nr:sugar ABC transporter substrate-binding protein [Bacillus sp. FJAT-50079]MBS4208656.1 sugar ABC transporter substrate-binding protein [Bacillus sp. FJAT-50079]